MKRIITNGITNLEPLAGSSEWYWGTDYASGDLHEAEDAFRSGHPIRKNQLLLVHSPEGKVYEDNAVVFKWLYSAGTVAVCDNVMYFYYVNNTGTTKSNYSIRKLDWLWALEEQIKFYTKIKFFKMVNAVGIRFIRESMREYENIQKYLQDQKQAKKLRRRIVRFFVKERKRVNISREETLDIFTRLYPRPMHFFWKIKKKVIK